MVESEIHLPLTSWLVFEIAVNSFFDSEFSRVV